MVMTRSTPTKSNFRPGSLPRHDAARTVLTRMAADQERAERIRALKQQRPDLTWRRIADHVGVTERSATDWQRKGGIEYDNAKRLAELFEVDIDYLWRGPPDTPEPAGQDDPGILRRLERLLERQNDLLARHTVLLERIEATTRHASDAPRGLSTAVAQAGQALRVGDADRRRAAKEPAPKPNHQA